VLAIALSSHRHRQSESFILTLLVAAIRIVVEDQTRLFAEVQPHLFLDDTLQGGQSNAGLWAGDRPVTAL